MDKKNVIYGYFNDSKKLKIFENKDMLLKDLFTSNDNNIKKYSSFFDIDVNQIISLLN